MGLHWVLISVKFLSFQFFFTLYFSLNYTIKSLGVFPLHCCEGMVNASRFRHLNILKFTTLILIIFKIEAINYARHDTREFNTTQKFGHASATVTNAIFMCFEVVSSGSVNVLMSGLTGLWLWHGRMYMRNPVTRRWLYDRWRAWLSVGRITLWTTLPIVGRITPRTTLPIVGRITLWTTLPIVGRITLRTTLPIVGRITLRTTAYCGSYYTLNNATYCGSDYTLNNAAYCGSDYTPNNPAYCGSDYTPNNYLLWVVLHSEQPCPLSTLDWPNEISAIFILFISEYVCLSVLLILLIFSLTTTTTIMSRSCICIGHNITFSNLPASLPVLYFRYMGRLLVCSRALLLWVYDSRFPCVNIYLCPRHLPWYALGAPLATAHPLCYSGALWVG